MQDNEKLVKRLTVDARDLEKDDWIVVAFRVRQAITAIETLTRENAELRACAEFLRGEVHNALDKAHVFCAERDQARAEVERLLGSIRACANTGDTLCANSTLRAQLTEAVGLLAEVFADHGKLNSLAWINATAGVIAKQETGGA